MPILADFQIAEYVERYGMISPYSPNLVRVVEGRKIVSYGPSSHGYDMRCTRDFRLCKLSAGVLDPKNLDLDASFEKMEIAPDGSITIPAHGLVLTNSLEYWRIPTDIQVVVMGKSTYARVGLIVNVTPMEAGWQGSLTIEVSNTAPVPVKIYPEEGIAQAIFHKSDPCEVSYADRQGKYMSTVGVTGAKV